GGGGGGPGVAGPGWGRGVRLLGGQDVREALAPPALPGVGPLRPAATRRRLGGRGPAGPAGDVGGGGEAAGARRATRAPQVPAHGRAPPVPALPVRPARTDQGDELRQSGSRRHLPGQLVPPPSGRRADGRPLAALGTP